jgi:hypothetical protein
MFSVFDQDIPNVRNFRRLFTIVTRVITAFDATQAVKEDLT